MQRSRGAAWHLQMREDSMNPLSPNQILRNLEHGYFMTHQEQSEAAAYIRQLQQAVLDERERVYNILISGDCDGSVKAYIRKILEQGAENQ